MLVTGPPGAGKTTVAEALAAELGFTLFAKDAIKEILHDALGEEADLAWSRRLGGAAIEMLWALAAYAPAAVLEANFWPDDPRHRAHAQALGAVPVEVHCVCPIEECMRRYAERAPSRHAVHVDRDAARVVGGRVRAIGAAARARAGGSGRHDPAGRHPGAGGPGAGGRGAARGTRPELAETGPEVRVMLPGVAGDTAGDSA